MTSTKIRLVWTHVDGRWGPAPCGRSHRKLEPTDIILSSFHAKKLVFLYQNFVFGRNNKWTFFVNIN